MEQGEGESAALSGTAGTSANKRQHGAIETSNGTQSHNALVTAARKQPARPKRLPLRYSAIPSDTPDAAAHQSTSNPRKKRKLTTTSSEEQSADAEPVSTPTPPPEESYREPSPQPLAPSRAHWTSHPAFTVARPVTLAAPTHDPSDLFASRLHHHFSSILQQQSLYIPSAFA